MYIEKFNPENWRRLQDLKDFLSSVGLSFDEGLDFCVALLEEGEIIASGGLARNVLKCIGVREDRHGEDLSARIVTELRAEAYLRGYPHLMLYTKPANIPFFSPLGFYLVASTEDAALMESEEDGCLNYAKSIAEEAEGRIGSAVLNCNPFTLGHRYLIEKAAESCSLLHVFVLSEDRSLFTSEERMEMVKKGLAGIEKVRIHETKDYLISSATFPEYFLKESAPAEEIHTLLDLTIFADIFAVEMRISVRFAGSEPTCGVTASYNEAMREFLPARGIDFVEIPRFEKNGEPVSASRVREFMKKGDIEGVHRLVPESSVEYIEVHMSSLKRPDTRQVRETMLTGSGLHMERKRDETL